MKQQRLGPHGVGEGGVVDVGMLVEVLGECQGGTAGDQQRCRRVGGGEAPGLGGGADVAQGPRGQAVVGGDEGGALRQDHLADLGDEPVEASDHAEAAREGLGRVVEVGRELVEEGALELEGVLDGGFEELLPRLSKWL